MFDQLSQLFRAIGSFWQINRQPAKTLPFAVVIVTLMLVLVFKFTQPEPPVKLQQEKAWLVQTQKLVAGAKSPQLELYGRVESPYTATITSSITADIKSLDVKEGQHVTKGQQLILLDDIDVQLTLEDKLSNVAELEALMQSENNRYKNDLVSLKLEKSLVRLAEKKLAREEKTSKTNLTSQSSFDSQKQALQNQKLALNARKLSVTDHPARLAQLEARLSRNRALAQQAQHDLQRATVVAPFDGIILNIMVSPGERLRPGEVLLEAYATEQVELRAQLPQKYVAVIKQSLANEIPLPAKVQTGVAESVFFLNRISGLIADGGYGVDALFVMSSEGVDELTNDDLTIGETLEMILVLPPVENAFSLPVSSIYGSNRIYRVEDERLVAVKVEKLGSQYINDNQFVLVRSEKLKPGDEIIITQLPHAVSGLKVEVHNTVISQTNSEQQISSELP
ncbi:MAG: efflux RND transporter periplasmic adaptor subunit [Gammaproteobacteria bacterium]